MSSQDEPKRRADVVVLGDLGHSPRMVYHAQSLASNSFQVNMIGFLDSKPPKRLLTNSNISISQLKRLPDCFRKLPTLIRFVVQIIWQAVTLWWALIVSKRPQYLILQNPPSVPALPICWFYCLIFRVHFTLDWHNYGYSILSLGLGEGHPFVFLYQFIEKYFGRLAHNGLCVSHAMKYDLEKNWGVKNITVHYDKPPADFRPLTINEKHESYLKLASQLQCFSGSTPDKTVFTERFADGRISFSEDRPALVVSSTSWTEDEDFSVMIKALSSYEIHALASPSKYPRLIVIVTGKGPLKDFYLEQARACAWETIQLETVWLESSDYPQLLAAADIGLSLHSSSSGLDLPMKVVDMFGCGLPVIAKYYPALEELVQHNCNGVLFNDEEELADCLVNWFQGFPKGNSCSAKRALFSENIAKFRQERWEDSWQKNVLPLLTSENRKSLPAKNQ